MLYITPVWISRPSTTPPQVFGNKLLGNRLGIQTSRGRGGEGRERGEGNEGGREGRRGERSGGGVQTGKQEGVEDRQIFTFRTINDATFMVNSSGVGERFSVHQNSLRALTPEPSLPRKQYKTFAGNPQLCYSNIKSPPPQ